MAKLRHGPFFQWPVALTHIHFVGNFMVKSGGRAQLSRMTRTAKVGNLFDFFADDLLAERSPRPLIIVAASKVDHLLLEILVSFFLPKISRAKDTDELLDGDNPLATFSARTKICRRLGIIDETLYLAIDRLRVLRNLSAHSVSFDHGESPAREHIAELRKHVVDRRSYRLTRDRFFDSAPLQPIEEL